MRPEAVSRHWLDRQSIPDSGPRASGSGKSGKSRKSGKSGKSGYFLLDLLIFAMDPLIFDMKIEEILRKTNGFTRISNSKVVMKVRLLL